MVIFDFWRKVPRLWRHPGRRESHIHFRFLVSGMAWPIMLELSVRFVWKLLLPVWWAAENCENKFRWSLLTVFFASLACHTGCPRPPVSHRSAGGGRAMCPLTDLIELGDFRFFGFLGSRGNPFYSQNGMSGESAPLLATKYEPDVIKTDQDIDVGNCMA